VSAAPRRAKTKVDPELRRQLTLAATSSRAPVEAVLRLRSTLRSTRPPEPQATRDLAQQVIARVAQELGADAGEYDFNVFPNLGCFVVSAPPGFVERVLVQPEVVSASANRRRE
jgi:hypothetical protein